LAWDWGLWSDGDLKEYSYFDWKVAKLVVPWVASRVVSTADSRVGPQAASLVPKKVAKKAVPMEGAMVV